MIKCFLLIVAAFFLVLGCYQPTRNCQSFKDGEFSFTSTIDGVSKTTTFVRKGDMEIDYFEGKQDTADIRWINDCEYIVKKRNPKNIAEGKSVHIKILSTNANTYTFEYGLVGSAKKVVGTASKINLLCLNFLQAQMRGWHF